jgi:hypothetical protein
VKAIFDSERSLSVVFAIAQKEPMELHAQYIFFFVRKKKENSGTIRIIHIRPKGGLPSSQDYAGYSRPVSEWLHAYTIPDQVVW